MIWSLAVWRYFSAFVIAYEYAARTIAKQYSKWFSEELMLVISMFKTRVFFTFWWNEAWTTDLTDQSVCAVQYLSEFILTSLRNLLGTKVFICSTSYDDRYRFWAGQGLSSSPVDVCMPAEAHSTPRPTYARQNSSPQTMWNNVVRFSSLHSEALALQDPWKTPMLTLIVLANTVRVNDACFSFDDRSRFFPPDISTKHIFKTSRASINMN